MKVLSLDLSTKSGWAVFENGKLSNYGRIDIVDKKDIKNKIDYKNFNNATLVSIFQALYEFYTRFNLLMKEIKPDFVVIEQTNLGRQRISQKVLEWLHLLICLIVVTHIRQFPIYIDSSDWRKTVGLRLSKDDKKHNKDIRKRKGRGIINKKHLALRIANEKFLDVFGSPLKVKDNDIADAVLVGVAWLNKNGYSI